ncbi:hypothetical protein OROGR_023325 [Orobanche gracilis]
MCYFSLSYRPSSVSPPATTASGVQRPALARDRAWAPGIEVLFQNDSPATLLARLIGIIGPIESEMLAKGRDTYKHFTKNHMLYERNQDTNRLEYLIPKKSCLRHRLPMGDQGFIDFVAHLLETNPTKRPSASEALAHPWLQYPYEPISS